MDRPDLNQTYRENAWRHFTIHADQRLKMFQFYTTISTALLGGGILLFRAGDHNAAIILIGFLASFISFVFWKLDVRTGRLVKNAEDAIKYLDESVDLPDVDDEPNPLKLFTRDDFRNARRDRGRPFHFSYRRCFALVFVVVGLLGASGAIYGIVHAFGDVQAVQPETGAAADPAATPQPTRPTTVNARAPNAGDASTRLSARLEPLPPLPRLLHPA